MQTIGISGEEREMYMDLTPYVRAAPFVVQVRCGYRVTLSFFWELTPVGDPAGVGGLVCRFPAVSHNGPSSPSSH